MNEIENKQKDNNMGETKFYENKENILGLYNKDNQDIYILCTKKKKSLKMKNIDQKG